MTDRQVDDVINIGGKEPDGKPAAIGRWTFQTRKVRDEVIARIDGRVLNPFAGKTHLEKRGVETVRNDLNPAMDADYHMDAADLADEFGPESFDWVVLDPPFSQKQADEHYDSLHATDLGTVRRNLAPLVKPGGGMIEFGFSMWAAADYLDKWVDDEVVLFRRAIPDRPPIFMVVDRHAQTTADHF